jgi:hypothetical protein
MDMARRTDEGIVLSIDGEERRYPNNKEGKRQAILDSLQVIPTVTVGEAVYLPSNAALQAVAAVLYPGGIESEPAYRAVAQTTEKACAYLGFGEEVALAPPAVPFAARGSYRKQYPPLDEEAVLRRLERARLDSFQPRQTIGCEALWNEFGYERYRRRWSELSPAQQTPIREQIEELAARAGWAKESEEGDPSYVRPLAINRKGALEQLRSYIGNQNGRSLLKSSLIHQAQVGAYGRGFYDKTIAPELERLINQALQAQGYNPVEEDGEHHLQALAFTAEEETALTEQLAAIPPVMTEMGQALLLAEVVAVVERVTETTLANEWQAEALAREGAVNRALRQMGYKPQVSYCQSYQFQPRLPAERAATRVGGHPVLFKEVRVLNDRGRKLALAKGLAVFTPALTIDDEDDTLVYLEMVGAKQAVKGNWAALVGGGKVHWLGRKRIQLEGMKGHVKLQTTLPCGWVNQVLLHKQASLKEMNPEMPFYLLDDGGQRLPPLFYPMLNRCLALPLLPAWAGYLWEQGRERKLIRLLDNGEGQGYAAWRALPAPEVWQQIVQAGLAEGEIGF